MSENQTTAGDDLPCGACDVGIYDITVIAAGFRLFAECQSRRDALKCAPRCKHNARQICMGARDFIVGSAWPLDAPRISKELRL